MAPPGGRLEPVPGRGPSTVMATPDLKCPNEHCARASKWTNLSVCPSAESATVHAIYQPQPSRTDTRRRPRLAP
jgi:hypothetical protein